MCRGSLFSSPFSRRPSCFSVRLNLKIQVVLFGFQIRISEFQQFFKDYLVKPSRLLTLDSSGCLEKN